MVSLNVRSNFTQFIQPLINMKASLQSYQGIRLAILNEVYYACFVEFGTSKMDARAMVRRSLESIDRFLLDLWHWMPFPFTAEDIELLMELVKDFAIEEIKRRTPIGVDKYAGGKQVHKAGTLKEGFQGRVERI